MKVFLLVFFILFSTFSLAQDGGDDDPMPLPCNGALGYPHHNGLGFVAFTAKISKNAYIDIESEVCDFAQVLYNAKILGRSSIRNQAIVTNGALIIDSEVYENSIVEHGALIKDSKVYGNARVAHGSMVLDRSHIYDFATLLNAAKVINSKVYEYGKIEHDASAVDHSEIFGEANLQYSAIVSSYSKVSGKTILKDKVKVVRSSLCKEFIFTGDLIITETIESCLQ